MSDNSPPNWVDGFDAAWQHAPYPDLRKWMKPIINAAQSETAIELCAIDLEWRWRVGTTAKASCKKSLQKGLPVCPFAEDYRVILGECWNAIDMRQRLMIVEWGVRNVWGDRPDTDVFQLRFPEDMDVRQKLESHLDSLLPLNVSVLKNGSLIMQSKVPARFQIGRQRREEPTSPTWVNSTSRLLIAKSEERQISRKQVQIRRTRRGEIEITNAPGSFCVRLDLSILEPNQISRFTLPVELRFGDMLTWIGE
jgi:hypothetical protein